MQLRRYWLLSGVFLWIDAYRRYRLYRQFVAQAQEVRRLRKMRYTLADTAAILRSYYGGPEDNPLGALQAYALAQHNQDMARALQNSGNPYRQGLYTYKAHSLFGLQSLF